ncbi:uncharacterized protein LOC129928253 [Biomphalaria glabrata]|uniref:Uncharacterized protein LOC129928253 n=1 Tax=Biomphalaria glabrata TaxID=6526 RepID=A0A9W3BEQ5_BIOGL|nr:uncharacterized protein LOC129928253 [Biomphalaria glabrata]
MRAPATIIPVAVLRQSKSLKIIGKIGCQNYHFLLDTVASRSVIRMDKVDSSKKTPVRAYSLKTASGELMAIKGLIDITVQIGNQSFKHEFLIADVTDDCIIGLDFMLKYGISLNIGGGTLQCGDLEVPLLGDENEEDGRVRRIKLVENTTLPAKSEMIIWGKIENGYPTTGTALVESLDTNPNGIEVGKTLVMIGKDLMVPVRIMNLGTEKHLREGSTIAGCHALEMIRNCSSENPYERLESSEPHVTKLLTEVKTILSKEQYTKAEQFLREFSDILPSDEMDFGRTNLILHRIDTGNTRPMQQQPRRLPLAKHQEAMDIIERMRQQGVVESSNSPWCSPFVLVEKWVVLD